jgi:hypothetical protein
MRNESRADMSEKRPVEVFLSATRNKSSLIRMIDYMIVIAHMAKYVAHASSRRLWIRELWDKHRDGFKDFIAGLIRRVGDIIELFLIEAVISILLIILIALCHFTCDRLIRREDLKADFHELEYYGFIFDLGIILSSFAIKICVLQYRELTKKK